MKRVMPGDRIKAKKGVEKKKTTKKRRGGDSSDEEEEEESRSESESEEEEADRSPLSPLCLLLSPLYTARKTRHSLRFLGI